MNVPIRIELPSREEWESNGWLLVPGFLGADAIVDLRREADRLVGDPALFEERGKVPNSARRSDRLDPVIDLSGPFAALARDSRLLSLLSAVLAGDAQLLKDKFIVKPPGAAGYGTHQDGAYWPGLRLDLDRFATAIIFLDKATADNGAIECAAGFHGALLTEPDQVADPDERKLGRFTTIEAEAGDLLLLHALTPHRSGPNRSRGMRRALLFTYGVDSRPDLYAAYKLRSRAMYA